jgi:hypothetical protein
MAMSNILQYFFRALPLFSLCLFIVSHMTKKQNHIAIVNLYVEGYSRFQDFLHIFLL